MHEQHIKQKNIYGLPIDPFWTFIVCGTDGVALRDIDMIPPANSISRRCAPFYRVSNILYKNAWKYMQFSLEVMPFFQGAFSVRNAN